MAKVIKRIKIKDLKIGDHIKTHNGSEVCFRKVTDKFETNVEVKDQRVIHLSDNTVIRCSNRHPIMCINEHGITVEVLPDALTSLHKVIADTNGELLSVVSVEGDNQPTQYVDLTVSETETFFVADEPESKQVLTHNCSQGGIRSSSVTMFYPFWHYEVEELLVLKNNRGTEETRARHSDYGIKLNALFYKRVRDNGQISLFSPHVSSEMYEAFHSGDNARFEELYTKLENDPLVRRKVIDARVLMNLIATERAGTGRIYIVNIDHANSHSSFETNIYQSNLCLVGDTELVVDVDGKVHRKTIKEVTELFHSGSVIQVMSRNNETGKIGFMKITDAAMTGSDKEVLQVTDTETGRTFRCTPEHRVWTNNRGYVEAKDLVSDDKLNVLVLKNESSSTLVESVDGTFDVYDITVDTNHNFYANDILVHNCLEITLPTKPFINTIEDGYAPAYIVAKDEKAKTKIENLVSKYNFLPRKYEGKLYKRVKGVDDITKKPELAMNVNTQDDTDAEMALCILAAINLGKVHNLYDGTFEKMIYSTVRALDNLIDNQEYPVRAAEISSKMRRTLGVGVTNFAYYLAKRGLRYSDGSANKATHELFEAFQYYLIKASVALAKERGACEFFNETKYSKGILPIDTYHKGLDNIGKFDYKLDWEELRASVLKYGMRHSTLSAQMPVESSSKTTSSTNGIELPKELYSVKDGVPFVVPEINELFANYETMWEQTSMTGYMNLVGIMQKFMDQAISGNTFYDPNRYGGKVPLKNIIRDIIYGYSIGWKTMYYHYTNDDSQEDTNSPLPNSETIEGDDCSGCKV